MAKKSKFMIIIQTFYKIVFASATNYFFIITHFIDLFLIMSSKLYLLLITTKIEISSASSKFSVCTPFVLNHLTLIDVYNLYLDVLHHFLFKELLLVGHNFFQQTTKKPQHHVLVWILLLRIIAVQSDHLQQ